MSSISHQGNLVRISCSRVEVDFPKTLALTSFWRTFLFLFNEDYLEYDADIFSLVI